MKIKELLKISSLPVIIASLCCLSPVILVLFGLSTASFASSLADTLYGEYKWVFRTVGAVLLALSIVYYVRRTKGICTLDEAKKRRTEVINIAALSLVVGIVGYFFFLYVVVEYAGIWLGLW
jgi:amino acid transporter